MGNKESSLQDHHCAFYSESHPNPEKLSFENWLSPFCYLAAMITLPGLLLCNSNSRQGNVWPMTWLPSLQDRQFLTFVNWLLRWRLLSEALYFATQIPGKVWPMRVKSSAKVRQTAATASQISRLGNAGKLQPLKKTRRSLTRTIAVTAGIIWYSSKLLEYHMIL